ncbi:MAG TPA: calcium-binding protein [Stellaceae bacterium]|nr:calcium-binding protein [Stellaceae bacterium]
MATVTYTWTNVVDSFFVNDAITAGNQEWAAITAINGGADYFTLWSDPSPDLSVEGRIIGSDGTPTGSQFPVTSTTAAAQFQSSIAQLTGGNVIVSFTDTSADAGGDIRARLFTSAGTPVGLDFGLSTGTNDNDSDSDVAALADGGFVVSWTRNFGSDVDIEVQVFNSDGSARSELIAVDSLTTLNTYSSQVAGLTGGNFVVVWQQEPTAGGDTEVKYRMYDASGSTLTASTLIDTTGSINKDIQVVALQDGGFAVAYTDNGWGIDGVEITVKIFNADGTARTGFLRANTDTAGGQFSPTLTVMSNGYLLVGWRDGAGNLFYQAYDANGNAIGANFLAAGGVVEGEVAALSGGLVANVRSSTIVDAGGDQSIRSSVDELTRTTIGDGTNEVLTGDSLSDKIYGMGGDDVLNGFGGDDALDGGDGNDTLNGGGGNDALLGGAGADALYGGGGNDTYFVDNAGDWLTEASSAGIDKVNTSLASYTLGANVENLTFFGSGNFAGTGNTLDNYIAGAAGDDTLNGGGGDDILEAHDGNDTLNGGGGNDALLGGAGADTLIGGGGNDAYYVDNAGDVVSEGSSDGTDTVNTSLASYTLGANVEKLTFTGAGSFAGTGNALDNFIFGGDGNDTLIGGAGNDWLNGGGGADALSGGGDNDTYIVDNTGDVVTEASSAGTDLVGTFLASYTLGANVETLTFIGSGNFSGTGNSLDNVIFGGAGNDTLRGGSGADWLSGLAGNDTYYVDNAGDVVVEESNAGIDTVNTSLSSYTLGANVEKLTFTGVGGDFAGTGNGLNNVITGGGGADTLRGGTGADTLIGGAGNDTYYVDNAGDVVTEASGGGTDTVNTSLLSYTLGANVEKLTFTGVGSFAGTGNTLNNTITGGTGNDTLIGGQGNDTLIGGGGNDTLRGGLGNDQLTGGAGNDAFRFDTALGASNVDQIFDFSSVADKILLDDAVFTAAGAAGTLAAGAFVTGSAAADADDRIIYNNATGALIYDSNGTGAGGATQFALLSTGLALTNSNFTVV